MDPLSDDYSIESINTPNQKLQRPMALPMRRTELQQKIAMQKLRESTHANTMFNISKIEITAHQAITDAGKTGHFIHPGSPPNNIQPETRPLVIHLPDGETLESSRTGNLDIP